MSAEQKALADTLVISIGILIYVFRAVFAILLLILVVKAIKYFHGKNKYNCATCIYKQRCMQQELANSNQIFPFKDG